jgi:8-oxo-dGTP pyrophosphatase MutT (NUDIX family)
MALPGGRQEPGDATLEATALRETREEVGLDLQEAELWGALAPVRARRPPGKSELWVTPYVYRIEGLRPVTQANEKEVAEIVWVPVSLLLRAETQTKRRVRHNGSTFILPAWQIGARMVWGLTHAIVSQLLSYTRPDHDVH